MLTNHLEALMNLVINKEKENKIYDFLFCDVVLNGNKVSIFYCNNIVVEFTKTDIEYLFACRVNFVIIALIHLLEDGSSDDLITLCKECIT